MENCSPPSPHLGARLPTADRLVTRYFLSLGKMSGQHMQSLPAKKGNAGQCPPAGVSLEPPRISAWGHQDRETRQAYFGWGQNEETQLQDMEAELQNAALDAGQQ